MHIAFGVGQSTRITMTWRNIVRVPTKTITTDVKRLEKSKRQKVPGTHANDDVQMSV